MDDYEQVSEDYGLSEEQQLCFLHNILRKDVHRNLAWNSLTNCCHYEEAFNLPDDKYNSVVRQTCVRNHFSSPPIDNYVRDTVYTTVALVKVYKRILKMFRKVPESHRGDHLESIFCTRPWLTTIGSANPWLASPWPTSISRNCTAR